MRAAVIGIGSNSVRMLIADLHDAQGTRVKRDRAGTRLFAGLDQNKRLTLQAMASTGEAVRIMAESAREVGAEDMVLFATSATRDASNADDFAALLKAQSGLTLQVLPGEDEAMLSFLGATGNGRCGVIDIGGGSTEIVIGEGTKLDFAISCQMGAVRLSRLYPIQSIEELDPVLDKSGEILQEKLAGLPELPDTWYGTGGTFTTLAAMVNGVPWTDRTQMHGTQISYGRVLEETKLIAPLPLEARRQLPGLQPNRADIIVHGLCILLACMQKLHIGSITVSEYGNLDGFMKHHYHLDTLT